MPLPADQRVPQTATYQGAPMGQPNPYQGAPQPYYQAPGTSQASGINQMLAGQGVSVTPGQAAGISPDALALLGGGLSNLTGPAQEALAGQTGLLTGPGGAQDLSSQSLALQKALTGEEAGFSLSQLGVQGSNLALQKALLGEMSGPGGFQSQQLALTGQEQAYQLSQAQRALRQNATASGSVNTAGTKQSWSDLLSNYGFQQKQLALTGKEQQAQYTASKGQLDNAAKSLGISAQEVVARLNNAISQYGLQGKVDANSIAQQVAALQQGYLSSAEASMLQTLLAGAGIPIQAFGGG